MIPFMDSVDEKSKEMEEKCLDSQLWHACAGGMVQMPAVNSRVVYFPQGHAEHACDTVDFRNCPRIPAYILSRVSEVKFMADGETDEVYAKIGLIPINGNEREYLDDDDDDRINGMNGGDETQDKPVSFAKTLTQSDANNGGGFSVPRYCAETIFPRLDYTADPPVQNIIAKDVHGNQWRFRHIYRGTPRRHLLTTGWSTFVNIKKLVAGDSIVFLRAENGDLCVGIRRAKRGIGGGPESPSGWNPAGGNSMMPYGGFSAFLREEENKLMRNNGNGNGGFSSSGNGCGNSSPGRGRVRGESVLEAASMAANGKPFEVVYYPRASTPEFCVKSSLVKAALQVRWCSGMRFKMPFETEDSSRISWFMGTISSVQISDPVRWPDSPWRLLQVAWDEPDLLQNVKSVSPWLVESVSNMPSIHLSPFSPPRKKFRLPQHPDFPMDSHFPMPPFTGGGNNFLPPSRGGPFGCFPDNNTPAGMQGARHAQIGLSLSDFHLSHKLQSNPFSYDFQQLDRAASAAAAAAATKSPNCPVHKPSSDNVFCFLTIGNSTHQNSPKKSDDEQTPPQLTMGNSTQQHNTPKKSDDVKTPPQFLLFGQPILTEQQISLSFSGPVVTGNSSSDGNPYKTANFSDTSKSALQQNSQLPEKAPPSESGGFPWFKNNCPEVDPNLKPGHCKIFMDSEDVSRTLDLTLLRSYNELYRKLADMFGTENSETLNNLLYRDATGAVKHIGEEPFSEFMNTAKRLTILTDSSSDNVGNVDERKREKK